MSHYEDDEPMATQLYEITVDDPIGVGYGTITAGEVDDERAERIKEGVERNVVEVDPQSPGCCIDGRGCVKCMSGVPTVPRAKSAGGPLVTAYAAAEITGWYGNDTSSGEQRLERLDNVLAAGGIFSGAHVDENGVNVGFTNPETGKPKTGCGAGDRYDEIIDRRYKDVELVSQLTDTLLGDEEIESTAVDRDEVGGLNSKDVVNVLGSKDSSRVEILASEATPTGGHREAALVINYRENTTVDRDNLINEIGEQVFTVDMWYIDKVAKAMAGGPDAVAQYKQLKRAMVEYQVATYLTLCDGSQRLITIK